MGKCCPKQASGTDAKNTYKDETVLRQNEKKDMPQPKIIRGSSRQSSRNEQSSAQGAKQPSERQQQPELIRMGTRVRNTHPNSRTEQLSRRRPRNSSVMKNTQKPINSTSK